MEYKNQLEIEYVNDDIYKYAVNNIVELVKEDEETCYIKFHGIFLPKLELETYHFHFVMLNMWG